MKIVAGTRAQGWGVNGRKTSVVDFCKVRLVRFGERNGG